MAVKKVTQLTCDRCKRVIAEDGSAASADDEAPCVFHMEGEDYGLGEPVQYYDLCESCQDRVKALVEQITLTAKPKPKSKNGEAKSSRKKPSSEQEGVSPEATVEAPN